jgi:hypothetical protein
MVHYYLPYVIIVYYGASLSFCAIITCCGALPLPCAIDVCCGSSSFTLCCYYLLWCIVPCLALLLVMVCRFHLALLLFVMVYCPLPCATTTYCGESSFALCCCCLLWFVTFAMRCYYFLLWSIVPRLAMLLFVIMHRLCLTMLLLLFDVIHRSLPCIIVSSFHAFSKYSPCLPLCC